MIKAENLNFTYKGKIKTKAIVEASLKANAGDFIALKGSSGGGKSTLLAILGGLLEPDSGNITINGKDLYSLSNKEISDYRSTTLGFIFQEFNLIPFLSVKENIMSPAIAHPIDNLEEKAEELMIEFGLKEREEHKAEQLSTGEKQRTALARALITSPSIILADEPTGNLDNKNCQTVLNSLRKFAAQGGIVIMATHSEKAASAADSKLYIEKGKLCESV